MNTGIVLTGATGLVGGALLSGLSQSGVLTPSRVEMDVTDPQKVNRYLSLHRPAVIIHAGAFTDNNMAERERGDTSGECWRVNVEGTRNIADAAASTGAYVIYISTGSVFAGVDNNPGPFTESDPPSLPERLSWYGWTKAMGEKQVTDGAVIRLSHPLARTQIVDIRIDESKKARQDYLHSIIALFDAGKLYPLFTDQYFPVTFLDDVVIAVKRLLQNRQKGIFHIVSADMTTPHELATYAIEKYRLVRPTLPGIAFDTFIAGQKNPRRFTKYSAIDGKQTRTTLHLPARSWRETVDDTMIQYENA